MSKPVPYYMALVQINKDPEKFIMYGPRFEGKKFNPRTKKRQTTLKKIVEAGTPVTPEFLAIINKYADEETKSKSAKLRLMKLNEDTGLGGDTAKRLVAIKKDMGLIERPVGERANPPPPASVPKAEVLPKPSTMPPPVPEKPDEPDRLSRVMGERLKAIKKEQPKKIEVVIDDTEVGPQAEENDELELAITQLKQSENQQTLDELAELSRSLRMSKTSKIPVAVDRAKLKKTVTTDVQGEPTKQFQASEAAEELVEEEEEYAPKDPVESKKEMHIYKTKDGRFIDMGSREALMKQIKEGDSTLKLDELEGKEITALEVESTDSTVILGSAGQFAKPLANQDIQTQLPVQGQIAPQVEEFAADATIEKHPVTHYPQSVLLYFGSITKPEWDPELEKSVFEAKYTKEELIRNIDSIISTIGPKIFVYERKADTVECFHELVQLQFCLQRNMAKGARTKSALVPISSLTAFSNKLNGVQPTQSQQARGDFVEPLDETVIIPADPDAEPVAADEDAGPSFTPQGTPGVMGSTEQVQIEPNAAKAAVVKAYRDRPLGIFNKPVINKDIVRSTKVFFKNYVGPGNQVDPAGMYLPKVTIRTKKMK